MKVNFGVFITLFYLGILTSNAQINIKFIETVQKYQDSVKIIYNQEIGKDIIDENTFNLKHYFKLFDKLEFNPNLKFDYIYIDTVLDGNPHLYAKEKSFNLEKWHC